LLCLSPAEALAYIDPGTGSYVFQTLLAALFTAAILLRTFWARLTGLFRRRKPEDRTDRTAGE
jgi:hypothetical protein